MLELTPALDEDSAEPAYMQIYRYVRDEIMAGRLTAGSRLPSIRTWSAHLGMSRTPVALAYDQLMAEGYVTSKPRSGLFVSNLEHIEQLEQLGHMGTSTAPSIPSRSFDSIKSHKRAYHAFPGESVRYDFGYGSVDLSSFPIAKWRRLLNRCFLPENSRLLLYGDYQGEPELRVEVADYLHQVRGVRCDPAQIVIGAGTYHSLDLLFQLLRKDVACMAVEEAVNDGVRTLLGQFRFRCRPIRIEDNGIRLEDVYESGAQALYVTPSHQFPYGMTLSAGKRLKLLNWAKETQAYIIENDYDGEFRYGGRPIPSLQSIDDHGRVIYVGTFSKALTPAFRLSYLVLPPQLLQRFQLGRHSYDQLASPIFQKTLQLFMKTGDFERHMRKMRRIYSSKHDALLSAVRKAFHGDRAEIIGAGSGLHILLRVHNGMSEAELVHAAKKAGVNVYPTSAYALNPKLAPASTVLLGFGGLSEEEIQKGISLLAESWFN